MKWIWRALVALLTLVVVVLGGGYVWLRGSLPQVSGEIALAGLPAPVQVVRDRYAVPHIYAESETSGAFALGFVHAQDRLWQMEVSRRIGQGRLSELFGEPTVGFDKFLRTLGLYRAAERSFADQDRETRANLEAYAAGVNAFLERHSGPLPPEFVVFGLEPAPWRPADSLVWIKVMALNLSANWSSEILRARMMERLTPQQVAEAFAPYPGEKAVILPDMGSLYGALPLDRMFAAGPTGGKIGNGSNGWVVAGSRTATGKPLLANDPHLGLTAPAIWYFAHLNIAGRNVIGATLPGVPSIIVGRNDRIAWGFTNTGPDVQDFYLERLDPANPDHYVAPDGSRAFLVRDETIAVRGGEEVAITVRETRHGPVMSDIHQGAAAATPPGFVLALAWTALLDGDTTPSAGRKLMVASNWTEFTAALRDFHVPQQSIVYADVDGNIGYYAPGRIPIRKPANKLMGLAPAPGWDADFDWDGWIPFEQLPHALNPPRAGIGLANHKVAERGFPYHLTFEWESPYRIRRIEELMFARRAHSRQSFQSMQADIRSLMAADFLPLFRQATPTSTKGRAAFGLLDGWRGDMIGDGVEPLIFHAWYRQLTRLVFGDEMGELFDDFWAYRPIFMYNILTDRDGQSRWCDDVATPPVETCAEQLTNALDLAIADLEDRFGDDWDEWRWDEIHFAHSRHRPFSNVPVLDRLFDIKVPFAGDFFTLNRAANAIDSKKDPYATVHGPSLRAIYDLADLDRSLFMHSTGQSGNPLSPHYRNFAEPWAAVDYIPMTTRRDDVEAGAIGTLILRPEG